MKKKNRSVASLGLANLILVALPSFAAAFAITATAATLSPEQEAKRLGQLLKPIPDDLWKDTAGEKISEKYTVAGGDTLYDISKRLFGDPKYWPKVWAINNGAIGNPHFIKPGMMIAFMPGTGSSLPSVGVAGAESPGSGLTTNSDANQALTTNDSENTGESPKQKGRSQEWKQLPQQPWEMIQLKLPPEIDPQGFDRRSKIVFKTTTDFELDFIVTSDPLEPIGKIRGAFESASELFQGNQVLIEAQNNIRVGEVYAITESPYIINRFGARQGYAYHSVGQVRITGVRDGVYIGRVDNARGPIGRGTFLMPLPPKAKLIDPIPGPSPIEAMIYFDNRNSTPYASQFKQVFVDQGSEDGVQAGMVFRAYETKDPVTNRAVAPDKFVPLADMIVIQVSPRFSSCLLLSTPNLVPDKTRVVLLTDVSDAGKPWRPKSSPEMDELEKLDPGAALGPDEERELIQLERHDDQPAAPAPAPSSTPLPGEEPLPPPPADQDIPAIEGEENGMSAGPIPTAPEPPPLTDPSGDLIELPPPPAPETVPGDASTTGGESPQESSTPPLTELPPPPTMDEGAVEFPAPADL